MTDPLQATQHPTPQLVRGLDVSAKGGLVVLLALALVFPEYGNLEGKAAGLRAVAYPVLAFTLPAIWWFRWRERASFPWLADLLITITCFSDILGNRLDLYDQVVWFDDWMHFMNTGLLAGAVILVTMHRSATLTNTVERALAFGATAAVLWEIAEYFAFISGSSERHHAYTDTLGDLGLGLFGALCAAVVIHVLWRNDRLTTTAPQLERPESGSVLPELGSTRGADGTVMGGERAETRGG